MRKFKKILVGLDLSPLDDVLIKKTATLARFFEAEKVYFIHVAKDLALPEEVAKNYPDLLAPVDEVIEKSITDQIIAANFPSEVAYEVDAKEGGTLDKILRVSKIKDIDLIIMGRKKDLEGSGALAKRIALRSSCSVLFLPEAMKTENYKKLFVPVDFSSYSLLALEYAKTFSQEPTDIICHHVYEVPHGYSKTGKSYEEFAEIMRENAQKDYQQFLQKNSLPEYPCKLSLREKGNRAAFILDAAKQEGADLIIFGSRGRTDSAALLIGSVAEKLLDINNEIPMLMLKKKGENMDFLEALFNI
ncbi:MAG TPA: universal stress protein [Cyclobacteriaceae bacterium]|nr:universal stress protein [Cyclobacteriaceae bacterium]